MSGATARPTRSLRELYAKAKRDQWDGAADLDWSTDVDPEEPLLPAEINPLRDYAPFKKMNAREQRRVRHCQVAWQLSQFMHGEQGALIVASQLVSAVPMMDAKLYAASQTMDEARHVEVFSRYLKEKIEWEWAVNQNLKRLLDTIIQDSRWDLKYLGMQILVEGLAMAAFANFHQLTNEKLLKDLIHSSCATNRATWPSVSSRSRTTTRTCPLPSCATGRTSSSRPAC